MQPQSHRRLQHKGRWSQLYGLPLSFPPITSLGYTSCVMGEAEHTCISSFHCTAGPTDPRIGNPSAGIPALLRALGTPTHIQPHHS